VSPDKKFSSQKAVPMILPANGALLSLFFFGDVVWCCSIDCHFTSG
jgi:hypothetical protein